MKRTKDARWLKVAKRAAEFRLFGLRYEATAAAQQHEGAQAALSESTSRVSDAHREWRETSKAVQFSSGDFARFRIYADKLHQAESRCAEVVVEADAVLDKARAVVRRELAEKNLFELTIRRHDERTRRDQESKASKEMDEVWSVLRSGGGGR